MPMMTSPTLLVFPVVVDSALPLMHAAKTLGFRIVGASSVLPYPDIADVDVYVQLPFYSAPEFADRLEQIVTAMQVTHIHVPHPGVWRYIKDLTDRMPDCPYLLCGDHPFLDHWTTFSPSVRWAEHLDSDPLIDALASAGIQTSLPLTAIQYASIHRGFLRVPGQCDEEKLRALCSIMRAVPQGDIVEIGSLYGRSAYALGRLASAHSLGSTLCIDPWNLGRTIDQGEQSRVIAIDNDRVDFEQVFVNFLATAAEVPGIGYIRDLSVNAIDTYLNAARSGMLHPPRLPAVPVCGKIALLHIDGNHRYDQVVQDINTWLPHLQAGGWLLLDDYVWPFGDGPKRAGDELLETLGACLAFTCGDTLFIRNPIQAKGHTE